MEIWFDLCANFTHGITYIYNTNVCHLSSMGYSASTTPTHHRPRLSAMHFSSPHGFSRGLHSFSAILLRMPFGVTHSSAILGECIPLHERFSFEMVSAKRTPIIRGRQVFTKAWSLRVTVVVTFHVPLPYSNTEQSQLNLGVDITVFRDFR